MKQSVEVQQSRNRQQPITLLPDPTHSNHFKPIQNMKHTLKDTRSEFTHQPLLTQLGSKPLALEEYLKKNTNQYLDQLLCKLLFTKFNLHNLDLFLP